MNNNKEKVETILRNIKMVESNMQKLAKNLLILLL